MKPIHDLGTGNTTLSILCSYYALQLPYNMPHTPVFSQPDPSIRPRDPLFAHVTIYSPT